MGNDRKTSRIGWVRSFGVVGVVTATVLAGGLFAGASTVASAGTVDGRLWVSSSGDRSNPELLDAAVLSGKVAIFVGSLQGTKSVSFYLDGAAQPIKVENVLPYDFAGTAANGAAQLYDSALLVAGTHRVNAVRSFTSGSPAVSTEATFVSSTGPVTYSNFVSHNGTKLMIAGQPFRAIGYNFHWIGDNSCPGPSAAETDAAFAAIAATSKGTVVREAMYQGGDDNLAFTRFDRNVAIAKKYGIRIIPVLTNEWTNCEPSNSAKHLPWYQSGYTQTNDGYPLSFQQYAVAFARHYANEPTIAWYQLVNEPDARQASGSCDEAAAATALRTFADTNAAAIQTVDQNHMIDLGSISWCGGQGNDFQFVNAGKVGICDAYHDYKIATNSSVSSHLDACKALGKPSFVGEAGICADVNASGACTGTVSPSTLAQRAVFFQAKMKAYFDAGASGYLIWNWGSASMGWDIPPGDPTEKVMASFALTLP
jgi:mannan endo-1,4-beta-mannosidase